MQHKTVIVLLIIIFAISISQRESFAPVIPSDNTTSASNPVQQSGSIISQNYIWYIAIIVGVSAILILIYFSMKRNTKSY